MPEGDVVWRTARRLDAALRARALTTCDLRWPSLATTDLRGRVVLEVLSVGKHLLMRLEPGSGTAGPGTTGTALTLHSHLRMDGSWRVHRHGEPGVGRHPEVRAVLGNDTWTAVGHRLGMLDLVPTPDEPNLLGHLGPDLLGARREPGDDAPVWTRWDRDEALRRFAAEPDREIGEALLDQRNITGIGTFYRAEALFLRGIHPRLPVGRVGDLGALLDLARRLMQANLDRVQQVTTGDLRHGRDHWVYRRERLPCRRCGRTIVRADLGAAGQQRPCSWCPGCQPG